MKHLLFLFLVLAAVASCNTHVESKTDNTLTYEELKSFPVQCSKKEQQLAQLRQIQKIKNFAEDPDDLNEEDRTYNARLKATIWWFAYGCPE